MAQSNRIGILFGQGVGGGGGWLRACGRRDLNARRVKKPATPPPEKPPSELRLTLARNLRIFRGDRDMTQRALALAAEISPKTVWQIEMHAANVTLDSVANLAAALGVKPLDLLTPLRIGAD